MSEQLIGDLGCTYVCQDEDACRCGPAEWNESEHDRTGGPTYGIPLQEQVEQVEDALSKALELIEALVKERNEHANDVYQAQVEAQDWQNQFNQAHQDWEKASSLSEEYFERMTQQADTIRRQLDWQNQWEGCQREIATLRDERDYWKNAARSETRIADGRIEIIKSLDDRVNELTKQNTDLEIRNERQYKMIDVAKLALIGNDITGNTIH